MDPIENLPDANAPLPLDDFKIVEPEVDDIQEEVERLDSFREYLRDERGDSLTFGDY